MRKYTRRRTQACTPDSAAEHARSNCSISCTCQKGKAHLQTTSRRALGGTRWDRTALESFLDGLQ